MVERPMQERSNSPLADQFDTALARLDSLEKCIAELKDRLQPVANYLPMPKGPGNEGTSPPRSPAVERVVSINSRIECLTQVVTEVINALEV